MATCKMPLAPVDQVGPEASLSTIFTLNFVDPVPREYRCMLCEEAMKEPCHLSCCSASYCKACAERMETQSLECKECLSLSYSIEVDYQDEETEQLIQSLRVYCPLAKPGCMWRGELQQLENHLQWDYYDADDVVSCRYLPVPCPKGCDDLVPRRDMDIHAHMACKYRMTKCICGEKGTADSIDTVHAKECEMRIVSCPNNCKMPGVRYKELSNHMDNECPLQMAVCEYQSIGCDGWFPQKDSQAHYDTNIQDHLWLMSEKLAAMNSVNEELRSSFLYTQSICKKLQEKYNLLLQPLLQKSINNEKTETDAIQDNDEAEMDTRCRAEQTTETDSEEDESGSTARTIIVEDGGYAAMGRQDTLKRYQTVSSSSHGWEVEDRTNSTLSSNSHKGSGKKPIPPPSHISQGIRPVNHKSGASISDAFLSGHQAAGAAPKPVTTGSIALRRLKLSVSNLSDEDSGDDPADPEPEGYQKYRPSPPAVSPSYWQSTGFLQQYNQRVPTDHEQPSPPEYQYSRSQNWGKTPSNNGDKEPARNTGYANFRNSASSHKINSQHRALSKSRSADDHPTGSVKKLAANIDRRTRTVSTANPPPLPPKPMKSGLSVSANSISRVFNADNPLYKDFTFERELEMKLALRGDTM